MSAFETKATEQGQQIELLEAGSRSNQIVESSDQGKISNEIMKYQQMIKHLEENVNTLQSESVGEDVEDKDAEIQALHIYSKAAKLDLTSLQPSERPRSVEQKVLFEETVIDGNLTSIFNNDTVILETDETVIEKHNVEEDVETLPALPAFAKIESDTAITSVLPPTPNLRTNFDDELLPETPRIFANLRNTSLQKGLAPLIRKESDKTFLTTTPTPPLLQAVLKKSAYDPVEPSPAPSTPKRSAEEVPELESTSKRSRLEVPVDANSCEAWAACLALYLFILFHFIS